MTTTTTPTAAPTQGAAPVGFNTKQRAAWARYDAACASMAKRQADSPLDPEWIAAEAYFARLAGDDQ